MRVIRIGKWPRGKTWSDSGQAGLTFPFMMSEVPRYAYELLRGVLSPDATEEIGLLVSEWMYERQEKDPTYRLAPKSWHRGVVTKITKLGKRKLKEEGQTSDDNVDEMALEHSHATAKCSDNPLEILIVGEDRKFIRRILARLAPQQQRAIRLRWLEGLSYKAIGEALGITTGSARATVNQGMDRLRQIVGDARGYAT